MNIVVAISQGSGPGASSVAERVCELIDGVELAVPFTTRLPRSAEDDGFVFASQDVFERMIASDEFLEHVEILGHRYGTPRRSLQDAEITATIC
jgi:guanylate kinase